MVANVGRNDRLDRLRQVPASAGVLCDFDGTLSAIVMNPDAARPLDGAVPVLHRLAATYAVVAVISGRPVQFLARHLELERSANLRAVGLYGLESMIGGRIIEPAEAVAWRSVADSIAAAAEQVAPAGVIVERKGPAVTIHYRTAPEAAGWAHRFAEEQAARTGMIAHPGRMHDELRPPVPVDKGTAVAGLAAGLDAVCFLGDDIGDLPAFAALDQLAQSGVETVKVAVASDEVPPEMVAAADLVVDGPAGALALLEALLV